MRFRKEKEKTYSQANIDHLRSQLTAAQAENERLRLAMKDQYQTMQATITRLKNGLGKIYKLCEKGFLEIGNIARQTLEGKDE